MLWKVIILDQKEEKQSFNIFKPSTDAGWFFSRFSSMNQNRNFFCRSWCGIFQIVWTFVGSLRETAKLGGASNAEKCPITVGVRVAIKCRYKIQDKTIKEKSP